MSIPLLPVEKAIEEKAICSSEELINQGMVSPSYFLSLIENINKEQQKKDCDYGRVLFYRCAFDFLQTWYMDPLRYNNLPTSRQYELIVREKGVDDE